MLSNTYCPPPFYRGTHSQSTSECPAGTSTCRLPQANCHTGSGSVFLLGGVAKMS